MLENRMKEGEMLNKSNYLIKYIRKIVFKWVRKMNIVIL